MLGRANLTNAQPASASRLASSRLYVCTYVPRDLLKATRSMSLSVHVQQKDGNAKDQRRDM